MNFYFLFAGLLAALVGLIHSLLGERWVFRRMRAGTFVPTQGDPVLREPHVRILWASWHLVTIMGWCLAALLVWLALQSPFPARDQFVGGVIAIALFVSAALVFIATKGKHLGWVGLLATAILSAFGALSS
jgi:hypothetical protein